MNMGRCVWTFLGLVILAATVLDHPVYAQARSDGFSDAFFNDALNSGEMFGLWNNAFDRCQAAGQRPVGDCVIHRDEEFISHGDLTGPRCARVSDLLKRHYCIVIGSIAADLVVKFEVDSVEGFIKAHGDNFEYAIDSAGTEVWSHLNRECASSDPSAGCVLEDVSRRLPSRSGDVAGCKSVADPHGQADCLIARWVASQVRAAAMAQNVGVSGDFFYNPRVKPTLNDLGRRAQSKCDQTGSVVGSDCLVDSVAAVLPYGKQMKPYCRDIGDLVDRYLCVLTGALAVDLYVKIGIGTADAFLKDHGKDGERAMEQANAAMVGFLAGECPETTSVPRCGPKEVASRLESDPKATRLCASLTEDPQDINCLLANRVIKVLVATETQL